MAWIEKTYLRVYIYVFIKLLQLFYWNGDGSLDSSILTFSKVITKKHSIKAHYITDDCIKFINTL